jgi:hypothetical protein
MTGAVKATVVPLPVTDKMLSEESALEHHRA